MCMTVISKDGNCEWDEEKDLINRKKHHISFELASKVFYDPLFLEIEDESHSQEELRHQGFGNINGIAIITVFYTERAADGKTRHRLISARALGPKEKEEYEKYIRSFF